MDFLEYIQKIWEADLGFKPSKLQTRHKDRVNNIRSLELGGNNQLKTLGDYLYKDATVFLKRKKEKFDEYR